MEFVHTLCCYDNSYAFNLTTILKHFYVESDVQRFSHVKCVEAHMSILHSFWSIIAIETETFSYSANSYSDDISLC